MDPEIADRISYYRHQVASGQELHDEIEVDNVLEAVVHLDHPRVIGFDQDVTLRSNMSQLLLDNHVSLAKDLHSVDMPGVDFLD